MESAKTWPKMPFRSCKGRCEDCGHVTIESIECWVDVQEILDGFVRKVKARGNVDNRCVLVAEPAAARPGVETYIDLYGAVPPGVGGGGCRGRSG